MNSPWALKPYLPGRLASPATLVRAVRRWKERQFDRLRHTQTTEIDAVDEPHAVAARWPSSIALFRRIIRQSRVLPAEYTFIDLGCGKGRALLLAAELGFDRIIGVEFRAKLCEVACQNFEQWARTSGSSAAFSIMNADAADFSYPDGNLLIYMYNPFEGAVFERVSQSLEEAGKQADRSVVIAYNSDRCADILERSPAFTRVRMRPIRPWKRSTVSLFYNARAWRSFAQTAGVARAPSISPRM